MPVTSDTKVQGDVLASTRRMTRSASGSTAGPSSMPPPTAPAKKKKNSRRSTSSDRENSILATVKLEAERQTTVAVNPGTKVGDSQPGPAKPTPARKGKKTSKPKKEAYCVCGGEDDGTPMIRCEGLCQKWYHFRCVSLSESEAEEIALYICPTCHTKTGLTTIMDWEGPDAMEEALGTGDKSAADKGHKSDQVQREQEDEDEKGEEQSSDGGDDGSEDDYVAEPASKRLKGRRLTRRVSISSENTHSNSDDSDDAPSKRAARRAGRSTKPSASPTPDSGTRLKRRGSTMQPPPSKKAKASEERNVQDDPVRKYCLGKLEEVIQAIFLEHSLPESNNLIGNDTKNDLDRGTSSAEKVDVAEEHKQAIKQSAAAFVAQLEECLYHKYSETDKSGRPTAAGKYKERFRMLTFNLGKSDRVVLRQGIASGRITPSQLSVMSSTDLANEQTKQEIQIAEKEALEHSILKKMTAPRAKITHKGYEDIEDINGSSQRDPESIKQEAEQRMERERMARLRTVTQSHDPISPVLPESPITAYAQSSVRLPALSVHLPPHQSEQAVTPPPTLLRHPLRPLLLPTSGDIMPPMDDSLDLADLINIDDDPSPGEASPISPSPHGENAILSDPGSTAAASPEIVTPSGPSPFAPSQPLASPQRNSFDLSSLWTGKMDDNINPAMKQTVPTEETHEEGMDVDYGGQADDQDFDMFLDQDDKGKDKTEPPTLETELPPDPADLEALPRVWTGSIIMPLESLTPLAPGVFASQIGGRSLGQDSPLWSTLFPSAEARIDGRVQVDKSSHYLLTNRLNVLKELIAVCFRPRSEADSPKKYNELIDYLIGKGRHALIFPWGNHPNQHAPGRELYIIPLLREQPIPEYIEMLDDLQLPKIRKDNILLGVFVLNKGKLAPAPAPTPVGLSRTEPPLPPTPVPPLTGTSLPPNTGGSNSFPVNIAPSILAAEVAALTPEQIALMLRHLGQTASSLPSNTAPPILQPLPQISVPQFPASVFQAAYQPPPPIPSQQSPPSGYYEQPPYDNYTRNDHQRRSSFSRDDQGGRSHSGDWGRGFNRARGRPYGGDTGRPRNRNSDSRPSDSGWGNRGREGPSRSPTHGRLSRFGESASHWNELS